MSRGRRYDTEPKLNLKKVFAVIIAILVIIMFVVGIKELLKNKDPKIKETTFALGYYTVYENNKWGVIDTKQNIIIEPKYDEMIVIPDNSKDLFIVMENVNYETGEYTSKVLNSKKEELFTEYTRIDALYNHDESNNIWYETNCLRTYKDGKYGLINYEGKEIVSNIYDEIKVIPGTKGVVVTVKDKQEAVVDTHGTIITENIYAEVKALTDKYENGFIIKDGSNKYGVISSTGTIIFSPKYDEIKNVYGNNMYVVKENKTWKIVDNEENSYLENKFDDVKEINVNNIITIKNNKYGIVSTDGTQKVENIYDKLTFIYTDTYIAKKGDKYGIIDVNGEEKLPFEYSYIDYNQEADFIIAQVENSSSKLMDRTYTVKAEGIISEINTTKNYIKVRVGEDYKYYNFKLEEKESTEVLANNTLYLSKQNGKYGYVNEKGIVVVDYIYDDATEQNKYGYASIKVNGKWGAIDQFGKVIVEPKYDFENNLVIDFIGTYHLAEDLNANYYTK